MYTNVAYVYIHALYTARVYNILYYLINGSQRAFNRGRLNYYGFPFAKDRNKSLWTSAAINAVNSDRISGWADNNDNIIVIIIIIIDLDRRRQPRIASKRDKPRWAAPWPLQRPAMSYLFKRQRTGVRLNTTRDRLPWPFVVQLYLITITTVRY